MRYRAVAILALGAALLHCGDAGESPLAPPRPPGPPAAKLIPSDSTLVNTASADTVHFDVHYDEWDRSDIEDCRRAGGRWLNFGGAKARCSEVRGYRPAWPDRDCGAAYDYGGPVPAWVSDFYARHGVCPAPGRPSPTPQMAPGATADDALDCPEVEVQDPPPRDPDPERPPKPLGSPPEDPPPEEEVEVQDPPPRDPDPERPPPPEPPPPTMNATAHLHTSIGSLRVTLTRPPGAAGNAWEIETQEGTGLGIVIEEYSTRVILVLHPLLTAAEVKAALDAAPVTLAHFDGGEDGTGSVVLGQRVAFCCGRDE